MQVGGVTTSNVYSISGRVIIDGTDIGAHVVSLSVDREIPSGLPGGSGFTAASGDVTAVWGADVEDRVATPWGPDPLWPPRPLARVEVILADGSGNEWTQLRGVVVDPSGSTSTRQIRFGVRDNYRALDTLVNLPALANSMPALVDANYFIYGSLLTTYIVDRILRQAGRYATPPFDNQSVVSATLMGSTYPERGTITYSLKQEEDGGTTAFPNWRLTDYGRCVNNVDAQYSPNIWSGTLGGGQVTSAPVELTQEVVDLGPGSTFLRARFGGSGGGQVGLAFNQTTVFARYYRGDGATVDLASLPRTSLTRVSARFRVVGTTLTGWIRGRSTDGTLTAVGSSTTTATDLTGMIDQVRANGTASQGAFQVAFPSEGWTKLAFTPNAVHHSRLNGGNAYVGFKTVINENALDLLNAIADAEFAQWWIDETDVLQWWDRGLLTSQPVAGTLTGQDHVRELSWSQDADAARRRVHVKYQSAQAESRWRTNLTLWQNSRDTLEQGDTGEIFVNVPDDEIWLGIDLNPVRYGATVGNYWAINRGIRSVFGGIAVGDNGNERRTNSIIPSVRRVTDDTYVFEHAITVLQSGEQAALELPDESSTDTALWARRRGDNLPILRGKKRVLFLEETVTSSTTGDSAAPDYTHDVGTLIQTNSYATSTADYAAATLTAPTPRIDGLDIMPVLALQVGDRMRVTLPDVAELDLVGVVTGNRLDVDLANGTVSQSINLLPTSVTSLSRRWSDFGTVRGGSTWTRFGTDRGGDTWTQFGNDPLA